IMLPSFLIGELLYAVGGLFAISGDALMNVFQFPEPMNLHVLFGAHPNNGEPEDPKLISMIQRATQFTWYSFVFLLIFLFSLNRVKTKDIITQVVQVLFIGVFFAVMAGSLSLQFDSKSMETAGKIGFSVFVTGFCASFILQSFSASNIG